MVIKRFIPSFLLGCLVTGCAGYTFAYHYYGLYVTTYQGGKLLGPTVADDLEFSKCQNNGCVAMLTPDFYALKQDHIDCENNLSDTQAKLTQCLSK